MANETKQKDIKITKESEKNKKTEKETNKTAESKPKTEKAPAVKRTRSTTKNKGTKSQDKNKDTKSKMKTDIVPETAKSSNGFKLTFSQLTLPNGKSIKILFSYWIILIVLIILLALTIITFPNRNIRSNLMAMTSVEEIKEYCSKKDLNCTISTLSDYDVDGYNVTRVAFLADDFFDDPETSESESTASSTTSSSSSDDASTDNSKTKKNVYITVQKGIDIEEDTSETTSSEE